MVTNKMLSLISLPDPDWKMTKETLKQIIDNNPTLTKSEHLLLLQFELADRFKADNPLVT